MILLPVLSLPSFTDVAASSLTSDSILTGKEDGCRGVATCTALCTGSLHLLHHISHQFSVHLTDHSGQSSHGDLDLIVLNNCTTCNFDCDPNTINDVFIFLGDPQKQARPSLLGLDKTDLYKTLHFFFGHFYGQCPLDLAVCFCFWTKEIVI